MSKRKKQRGRAGGDRMTTAALMWVAATFKLLRETLPRYTPPCGRERANLLRSHFSFRLSSLCIEFIKNSFLAYWFQLWVKVTLFIQSLLSCKHLKQMCLHNLQCFWVFIFKAQPRGRKRNLWGYRVHKFNTLPRYSSSSSAVADVGHNWRERLLPSDCPSKIKWLLTPCL